MWIAHNRYYNIDTNVIINENGDCRPVAISSPDEGFGELNVSGLMGTEEFIIPDATTPEKKSSLGELSKVKKYF